jgi:hypothetical protein
MRLAALALLVTALAAGDASELRASHERLRGELAHNAFGRPLVVRSADEHGRASGEAWAVLEHPLPTIARALREPASWCEILSLHPNTKLCRPTGSGNGAALTLAIGRKTEQDPESAHELELAFHLRKSDASFLEVTLDAAQGPLGTSDYRIRVEAVPLDARRTFLHFAYAYEQSATAALMTRAYLGTIASGKVGFTVIDRTQDGKPVYVGGERGVVERNTMRYYLAIEAYLDTLSAPRATRFERRLREWFQSSEQYRRQLHELDWDQYAAMKRRERAHP